MLGDLNADNVVTEAELANLAYWDDETYGGIEWHWLIPNGVDTTVASQNLTYDRYCFCLIYLHHITRKSPSQS